jgi:hypothetical protein
MTRTTEVATAIAGADDHEVASIKTLNSAQMAPMTTAHRAANVARPTIVLSLNLETNCPRGIVVLASGNVARPVSV